MDDNGEGILFDTASHAESFLFSVLPEKVWRHNNGRVYVGAKPSGRPVDLASLRDTFDLGVASLPFGANQAKLECNVAVFDRPRHGCRCFWFLFSVYDTLGFTQASGSSAIWAQRCCEDWEASVTLQLGAEKQLLRSRPSHGIVPASEASRLLEWPSVGSVVLMWKLLGWALAETRSKGGLLVDRCKEAAAAFLDCVGCWWARLMEACVV